MAAIFVTTLTSRSTSKPDNLSQQSQQNARVVGWCRRRWALHGHRRSPIRYHWLAHPFCDGPTSHTRAPPMMAHVVQSMKRLASLAATIPPRLRLIVQPSLRSEGLLFFPSY